MLILVTGTDSYRRLQKVRELESAFQDKYDPNRMAIERLNDGDSGAEELASRLSGASLFSTRQFFRINDLIHGMPTKIRKGLLRALCYDSDSTIVVSNESRELKDKDLKEYKVIPKLYQYNFPELTDHEFMNWAKEYVTSHCIEFQSSHQELAERLSGNSWDFINEFWKFQSGGTLNDNAAKGMSVYDLIESFLYDRPSRWSTLMSSDESSGLLSLGLNQVRSLAFIQYGVTSGIHPFVIKKLSKMQSVDGGKKYFELGSSLVRARSGMGTEDELLLN